MCRDDKVFLMGEEVALYDGAYKVNLNIVSSLYTVYTSPQNLITTSWSF